MDFVTKNVDERNALIEKLYKDNIQYSYTDKDKEGNYHVKYESE